ncbi:MAG TPA: alpha/beta fold hydrolase [Vicinamibacterales bacterium]|nr:alpha/beta fold hydrolase [Vicinamibacterales bacterium]
MKRLRRVLVVLGILTLVAYVAAAGWLVTNESTLLFAGGRPLGNLRPATPFEIVAMPDASGPRRVLWLIRAATDADRRPWIIFLHGNDANVASRLNILHYERLRALGANVAAPEYRGFGGVDGVPSEPGLDADARAGYDYLRGTLQVAPRRIVIYGWSLGSAVAVDLASNVDEGAVILEGAPASIAAIGQQRYPYFPIRLLIRNPFDSILKIERIRAPMLFLHSPEDAIIPIGEGRRLFEAATAPKQWVEVTGGHVYAVERDPRFFGAIQTFLRTQRLLP